MRRHFVRFRQRWLRQVHWPLLRLAARWRSSAVRLPVTSLQPGLDLLGGDLCSWWLHAWLQWLPQLALVPQAGSAALVLVERPSGGRLALPWLAQLSFYHHLWVIQPELEQLLKRYGLPVQLLRPSGDANDWLRLDNLAIRAGRELGLPDPAYLARGEELTLVLGDGGSSWRGESALRYWQLPGFDRLLLTTPSAARLLAAWLQACQAAGLRLVRFAPTELELHWMAFAALAQGAAAAPLLFREPVDPVELPHEAAWRDESASSTAELVTPRPAYRQLWPASAGVGLAEPYQAGASVCVSLYNYSEHILEALASVYRQTLQPIELIIVDDHSDDAGPELVMQWLQAHAGRFVRAVFVQHVNNGGLAAARNTAIELARSEWCFILDADNQLEARALESAFSMATGCPADVAVVYGLIRVVQNAITAVSKQQSTGWLSERSWQQQAFAEWNYVDAMALIRRSAWSSVGGFQHIPGGWEDYDYWCTLMDHGFYGLLCPQVLATYRSHSSSMIRMQTELRIRAISRMLQRRHPWLNLPFATSEA